MGHAYLRPWLALDLRNYGVCDIDVLSVGKLLYREICVDDKLLLTRCVPFAISAVSSTGASQRIELREG
jgi:hypothetical protein